MLISERRFQIFDTGGRRQCGCRGHRQCGRVRRAAGGDVAWCKSSRVPSLKIRVFKSSHLQGFGSRRCHVEALKTPSSGKHRTDTVMSCPLLAGVRLGAAVAAAVDHSARRLGCMRIAARALFELQIQFHQLLCMQGTLASSCQKQAHAIAARLRGSWGSLQINPLRWFCFLMHCDKCPSVSLEDRNMAGDSTAEECSLTLRVRVCNKRLFRQETGGAGAGAGRQHVPRQAQTTHESVSVRRS